MESSVSLGIRDPSPLEMVEAPQAAPPLTVLMSDSSGLVKPSGTKTTKVGQHVCGVSALTDSTYYPLER